LALPDVD